MRMTRPACCARAVSGQAATPPRSAINSRRLITDPEVSGRYWHNLALEEAHVRFGSKADICSAQAHVRFTPDSDRESGFPQTSMSALPPRADMCGAVVHVRFGPKADME